MTPFQRIAYYFNIFAFLTIIAGWTFLFAVNFRCQSNWSFIRNAVNRQHRLMVYLIFQHIHFIFLESISMYKCQPCMLSGNASLTTNENIAMLGDRLR